MTAILGTKFVVPRRRQSTVVTRSVHPTPGSPVIVVLAARWESKSEEGWLTRHVAGALACAGTVHVVTPEGVGAGCATDGAFTVHRLGTPLDTDAERRRDLLVEGLTAHGAGLDADTTVRMASALDQELLDPWLGAVRVVADLNPDLVVVAGHKNLGALAAIDACTAPVALLALGSESGSVTFPHFAAMFDRADSILAATETERRTIADVHGRPDRVHRVGAPLAANPTSLTEPNPWVGSTDYILVVTDAGAEEDNVETELSRLIRLRFPDNPVGVCHNDGFRAWHQGRVHQGWAVERYSDMARLMAWARVTVDLHPTGLVARRCVDSLLYGTPIVVPTDSRAREHADRGRGGLWFSNPAELTWCIEALLDPPTRAAFGSQGRAYAETEYGSTDRFIERVTRACGLVVGRQAVPAVA